MAPRHSRAGGGAVHSITSGLMQRSKSYNPRSAEAGRDRLVRNHLRSTPSTVMAGLGPAIHVFDLANVSRRGCPRQGAGMTAVGYIRVEKAEGSSSVKQRPSTGCRWLIGS